MLRCVGGAGEETCTTSSVLGQLRKLGLDLLEALREPVAVEDGDMVLHRAARADRKWDGSELYSLGFLRKFAVLYGLDGVPGLFGHAPAELRHFVLEVGERVVLRSILSLCKTGITSLQTPPAGKPLLLCVSPTYLCTRQTPASARQLRGTVSSWL